MPLTQKAQVRFNKGLITESGELTFPDGASIDESNCTLLRTGNRKRRLGIEFEDSYVLSTATVDKGSLVSVGEWTNVGGQANLQYAVVQLGGTLYFYNKSISPVSGEGIPVSLVDPTIYSINLDTYKTATGSPSQKRVHVTSVIGSLIVASSEINTFRVERANDTGVFTESQITFRVRDYRYLGDKTTYDSELAFASLTEGRKYDTANTGWVGTKGTAALTTYKTAHTAYPALTHAWFSGKNAAGNFDEAAWRQVYSGSSLIANGHFILDLFNKDRKTAFDAESSGAPSTSLTYATEIEASRFKTVTTFAGRVFYAGLDSAKLSSNIYFSRLLQDSLDDIGECFQINDPTSEEIADLLDTDGGYINIPDAHGIVRLVVMGSSLFVLAENGVWQINGVDGVFRASEYSVSKITDFGIAAAGSYVKTEDAIFWWSTSGIHLLAFKAEAQRYVEENISIGTIQTFFNTIAPISKIAVEGNYDFINKKIFWMYPSAAEPLQNKFNEILILDIPLTAFIPWSVTDMATTTSYIAGSTTFSGVGFGDVVHNVVDSDGNQVYDSLGNEVVATYADTQVSADSDIKFLVRDGATGSVTFATFSSTSFLDWGEANYSSFAESGYDFQGDMSTRKFLPYINVYQKVTETGWTGDEISGYFPVRPGSLKMSAYWDFKTTTSSAAQQAYLLKYPVVVDPAALTTFDYPHTTLRTKLKLRGSGRNLRLRFESEQGKDFDLLGWEQVGQPSGKF
jgi:hypothetical protein